MKMVAYEIQLTSFVTSLSAIGFLLFRYLKTINFSGNISIFGYTIVFHKTTNIENNNVENANGENNHSHEQQQEIEINISHV